MRNTTILAILAFTGCKSNDTGFVVYDSVPTLSITDPVDGSSVDQRVLIDFAAQLRDDGDSLDITWSSDIDGVLNEQTITDFDVIFSTAALTPGQHTITLSAVDTAAQSASASIALNIIEVSEDPVIVVVHPASGEVGEEGIPFSYQAQVVDAQDDPIALRVTFESSIDGVLCDSVIPDLAGIATCSSAPSSGSHTLTYTVTDTSGNHIDASTVFSVTAGVDIDNDGDGFTEHQGDCNDNNPGVNPTAPEFYNGIDDDCNGLIDDATDGYDDDGDGFTELEGDCDDTDPLRNPDAVEYADGVDNDCDGLIDNNTDDYDDDGDGFSEASGDCNDDAIGINPNASDVPYNGVDEDCDGADLTDVDGDGHDASFVHGGDDCDDDDASLHPGATDDPYNGIDEDCDGADLTDVDGDGFDSTVVFGGTDCDDLNADINPGATEIPYDGIDQDCVGGDLLDGDGDGQNALAVGGTDCNDADPHVYSGAPEIPYDHIDQDCDGADTTDVDGDGYTGTSAGGDDCDDTDANINPGTTEIPYNGVDDDCSNGDLTDVDGDGYAGGTSGTDCDDEDVDINPGASEIPYNGVDEDCSNGDLRDVDGDGFEGSTVGGSDCNDEEPTINPGQQETCDGIDNDCSDGVDEAGAIGCLPAYVDGDGDGFGISSQSACTCGNDPFYSASQGGDCYDGNDQAHPGQTGWFTVDRGDGSFDYDCSVSTTMRYPQTTLADCNTTGCGFLCWQCDTTQGWENGRPNCGETENWQTLCGDELGICTDLFTDNNWEIRTQGCR